MKNHYFWTIVTVVFIVEIFSILPRKNIAIPDSDPPRNDISRGVIHVHSTFSDGGGSPDEIAKAALESGLDFVVLTDHNNDEARRQGFERNYGATDLFVEMESSTPVGHAVSFFSENETLKKGGGEAVTNATYRQFLKKEHYPGLFFAVAHPSNIKNPWGRLDDFAEGIEVVNFDSSWRRQLSDTPLQFLLTVILYPFNAFLASLRFFEVYPKDFVVWDEMTMSGPGHFAYLAHDTHSKVKLNGEKVFRWPDYLETFKLASNVLFLGSPKALDFSARKKQYYKSLREGRLAIHYHSIFPFGSNRWQVDCAGNKFESGDKVPTSSGCLSKITTPKTPFEKIIRLVKNGEVTHEVSMKANSTDMEPLPMDGVGTYRVEVWAKMNTALRLTLNRLVPYVFYSPIYLQ